MVQLSRRATGVAIAAAATAFLLWRFFVADLDWQGALGLVQWAAGPVAVGALFAGVRMALSAGEGVEVRTLTPDDWQVWRDQLLAALDEAPGAYAATPDEWRGERHDEEDRWRRRLALPGARGYVALLDGAPVGIGGGIAVPEEATVELVALWVSPEARGWGVGDRLVEAVAAGAVEQGARTLRLSVGPDNAHAVALYRRHGFTDAEAGGGADGADGAAGAAGDARRVMVRSLTGQADAATA